MTSPREINGDDDFPSGAAVVFVFVAISGALVGAAIVGLAWWLS